MGACGRGLPGSGVTGAARGGAGDAVTPVVSSVPLTGRGVELGRVVRGGTTEICRLHFNLPLFICIFSLVGVMHNVAARGRANGVFTEQTVLACAK